MIMARNEDGTYSQVGFVKDNAGIDTEYIYDKDGDIVFEKGFTRETSGTVPLTINGIGKDLKDWSITGNTVQNGTPTPENPVEVQAVGDRTGNLFDYSTIRTGYRIIWATGADYADNTAMMSDYIKVKNTTYSCSNTAMIICYDGNKNYLGALNKSMVVEKEVGTFYDMFTINDNECKFIKLLTYQGFVIGNKTMLNEGSTALPYEPYGYKIPVVTRGKNLAGNYTVSSGYYYDDSGTPTSSDARFIRLAINVEPNTIYTISSNLKFYSIWEFNNNTKISRRVGGNSNKHTIKTTKECNSLRISMSNTSGEADTSAFEWIQLEKGTTATPYEPYHEPITTPIYLPTPLYSGEVMRSDGSRELKWKKLVLTGKENVVKNNNDSTNYLYYIPMSDNKKINGYCSHLIGRSGAPTSIIGFNMNSAFAVLYFNFGADIMEAQSSGNTVKGFKEYLAAQYAAGTPVTVWYQLAKPTTETFTAPQIPTLNGTTVIDVDTAVKPTEMYTKYKSSK